MQERESSSMVRINDDAAAADDDNYFVCSFLLLIWLLHIISLLSQMHFVSLQIFKHTSSSLYFKLIGKPGSRSNELTQLCLAIWLYNSSPLEDSKPLTLLIVHQSTHSIHSHRNERQNTHTHTHTHTHTCQTSRQFLSLLTHPTPSLFHQICIINEIADNLTC